MKTTGFLQQLVYEYDEENPGRPIGSLNCDLLEEYAHLLLHWTKRVDLIAEAPLHKVMEDHILDCAIASLLTLRGAPSIKELMDVGSGAGLPGIVAAICSPETPLHLVEPRDKRAQFLKEAKRVLKLANVSVSLSTVQDLTTSLPDAMITRATGLDEVLLKFAADGKNKFAALMVGPGWRRPASTSVLIQELSYVLPRSKAQHRLILAEKK
jgi:16S rRNA (guanine(527)-N(7))-methyltransferase RsmG